jgi:hypothetical protein
MDARSRLGRLFPAESPLARSRLLLENLLRSHGVEPDQHLLNEGDGLLSWLIPFSTPHRVVVSLFEAGGDGYLRVSSPILHLPAERRQPFFRRLLDLNAEMVSASLATLGDDVCVVSVRPLKDLDPSEAIDLIGRVYIYACRFSEELTREFAAPPYGA